MVSCIDDESKLGNKAVSTLSFADTLEAVYSSERYTIFELTVPEVSQKNQEKPLSYEWQVNYKVESTSKDLKFECKDCGEFPCRLKISNEDGAIFREFTLKVPYPYEKGLVVLSRYDGRSMLSFRSEDDGAKFVKDVYRLNNESVDLGNDPKGLFYNDYYKCIYIATEEPVKVVKVEHNTMSVLNVLKYPEARVDKIFKQGSFDVCFMGGGRIVDMSCGNESFNNNFQQQLTGSSGVVGMYPGAVLANSLLSMSDWNVRFTIVYDTYHKLLLKYASSSITEICEEINGLTFIEMLLCRSKTDALIMVKNDLGEVSVVHHNVDENKLISNESAASAGMTDQSVFMLSQKEDILFYTNGNKIFRYNYISEGNFPTSPDYTVGEEGDVIKEMVLDPKEQKLYVAVDASTGDYRGGVYCYDNETKQLLWKETGVAGEIVQMIYKEK